MKLQNFLNKTIREDKLLWDIKINFIIKELSDDYFDFNYSSTEEIASEKRILIKTHIEKLNDERRGVWCDSVWFDGELCFITLFGGREGDDDKRMYVINKDSSIKFINYIREKCYKDKDLKIFCLNDEIKNDFYGLNLSMELLN